MRESEINHRKHIRYLSLYLKIIDLYRDKLSIIAKKQLNRYKMISKQALCWI